MNLRKTGRFLALLPLIAMTALILSLAMPGSASAATFIVANTADSGAGSLRSAISNANLNPGSLIQFNIPGAGPHVIQPAVGSPLPDITAPVIFDGYSQPGSERAVGATPATIMIVLDGSTVGNINIAQGLDLQAGSEGSYICGLCIQNWAESGIRMSNGGTPATHNTVEGCYLGTTADGSASAHNLHGIELQNSSYNVIGGSLPSQRNIISGNSGNNGVAIANGSTRNAVVGNYIGTDANGTNPVPNLYGVLFWSADSNTVGGTTAGERNVISGNDCGLRVIASSGDVIDGNYIGTDPSGTAEVGGGGAAQNYGVIVEGDSNIVGGTGAGAGNIISGHDLHGVALSSGTGNSIAGNIIGLDANGNALGNHQMGVMVESGGNVIGELGHGNVISGNGIDGVSISYASSNHLFANIIGMNASGTAIRSNGAHGIRITGGSSNVIGGTTPDARNYVSGNTGGYGISMESTNTNSVYGNWIGVDSTGGTAFPNNCGIGILSGDGNRIGSTGAGTGNLISGNTTTAVTIESGNANCVRRNLIGTNAAGDAPVAGRNANGYGIEMTGSTNTTIGGAGAGESYGNTISGNMQSGIVLQDNGGTVIQGNLIGTDSSGTARIANSIGIELLGGLATVGGDSGANPCIANTISGNTTGIRVDSSSNRIEGNRIGTGNDGTTAVANGNGIECYTYDGNWIGGDSAGKGNIIAGNSNCGLYLQGISDVEVHNNRIGLGSNGNALANSRGIGAFTCSGICIGTTPLQADGNIISGNDLDGIYLDSCIWPEIAGNTIGTDPSGTQARPNGQDGVHLLSCTCDPDINTGTVRANLLSGNAGNGIHVLDTDDCKIRSNRIGTTRAEDAAIPNGQSGILLDASSNCLIGGDPYAWHNVISGNAGSGVRITGGASSNKVDGNFIGDVVGLTACPNGGSGILVAATCYQNDLQGNSIYSNGDLGIKLTGDGNHSLAAPVLNRVAFLGGDTAMVEGTAPAGSTLEFYLAGPVPDPSGAGQGRQPIGTYPCPDSTFSIQVAGLSAGEVISAIAIDTTNNDGDTSQFSNNGTVTDYPAPAITYLFVNEAPNDGPVDVGDLHGSGFLSGATVALKKAGQSDVPGTNVQVLAGDRISCTFDITNAAPGGWEVWVENVDGKTGVLVNGFTVLLSIPVVKSVEPPEGKPGTHIIITGDDFGDSQGTSKVTVGGVEAEVVSWSDTRIVITAPEGGSGPVVVTTAAGKSNDDKPFTLQEQWYLAEGSTAWGFSTSISMMNPNASAVSADITYLDSHTSSGGAVLKRRSLTLPAASQTTINAGDDLGFGVDFSTTVQSNGGGIAVERTMIWQGEGAKAPEAHSSIGVKAPAQAWYLPEGSSGWGFETWVLVENPGAADAKVTLDYMVEGAGLVSKTHVVPRYSRATFGMAQDIGEGKDASVRVTSDRPVVAERSMYRNARREGSCSIGAVAAATTWFLSEGSTAWGFTTYVLLMNPSSSAANVNVTYQTPDGKVSGGTVEVPAGWRKTVRVNDAKGMGNTDESTFIESDQPVVAERAMYWDNGTGEACHDSIGVASAGCSFMLPDGRVSEGWETWTLVQNANPGAARIRVTYMTPTGEGNVTFTDELPAGTRRTYLMNDRIEVGGASVLVEALDGARPVMVERSMYKDSKSLGTDTIGSN